MTWKDGDRYDGEWRDGKMHGRGTMTYKNGGGYEGEWKDGKKHGRGTVYFASGNRWEGKFRDGKAHGRGVYYDKFRKRLDAGRAVNGCFDGRRWRFSIGTTYKACGFK